MQKIPSLYGFSIITLVLVLMVINHFVYLRILENSLAQVDSPEQSGAPEDLKESEPVNDQSEGPANGIDESSIQDALDESSVDSGEEEGAEDGEGEETVDPDPEPEDENTNGTSENSTSS